MIHNTYKDIEKASCSRE